MNNDIFVFRKLRVIILSPTKSKKLKKNLPSGKPKTKTGKICEPYIDS